MLKIGLMILCLNILCENNILGTLDDYILEKRFIVVYRDESRRIKELLCPYGGIIQLDEEYSAAYKWLIYNFIQPTTYENVNFILNKLRSFEDVVYVEPDYNNEP